MGVTTCFMLQVLTVWRHVFETTSTNKLGHFSNCWTLFVAPKADIFENFLAIPGILRQIIIFSLTLTRSVFVPRPTKTSSTTLSQHNIEN